MAGNTLPEKGQGGVCSDRWGTPNDHSGLKDGLLVYGVLLLTAFAAYFYRSAELGLYEDDWVLIAPAVNACFDGFISIMSGVWSGNPEGRPIGFALPAIAYAFYQAGGLHAIYLPGLFLTATNAFLLYRLLGKRFPPLLALLGAFFFLLSPADTTKCLPIHIYQLQPSLLFVLTGLNLYAGGRHIAGTITASLSLLTYEIAFLPFFFATFFEGPDRDWRALWGRWLNHACLCVSVVLIVLIWRTYTNEERVTDMLMSEAILNSLKGLYIGPITAIKCHWQGLVFPWNYPFAMRYMPALFAGLWAFFSWYISRKAVNDGSKPAMQTAAATAVLLGSVMFIFSYAFSGPASHYPPNLLQGRGTSVHLAATVSAAVALAGAAYWLYLALARRERRVFFAPLAALLCASYIGYGMVIQADFAGSARLQRKFWGQVLKLCPDLGSGTKIIIERDGLRDTFFIVTHSWSEPAVLEELLIFPADWTPPRLFMTRTNFADDLYEKNGKQWIITQDNYGEATISSTDTICLRAEKDVLSRENGPVTGRNTVFYPKPQGPPVELRKKNMHRAMFRNE